MMARRRHAEAVLQALVDDAIENGATQPVVKRFQDGLRDEELEWAVQNICKRGSEEVLKELIFEFPVIYAEYVLKQLVRRRLWGAVYVSLWDALLGDELRTWAIDEAIKHADDKNLSGILQCCCKNQADLVLETAVCRRLWEAVDYLLFRVSDQKRAWAVDAAIRYADQRALQSILYCIADDQVDFALSEAVKRGWLSCVNQLLCHVPKEQVARRQKLVADAIANASDTDLKYGNVSGFDEIRLAEAARRGMWTFIASKSWNNTSINVKTQVILKACESTTENEIHCIVCCLSLRNGDETLLNTVIPALLAHEHWSTVAYLISSSGVTSTLRKQILQEASKKANEHDLEVISRGNISPSELDVILPELMQRQLWKIIIQLWPNALTEEQKLLIIVKAINTADDCHCVCLLSRCSLRDQSMVDGLMRKIVEREMWNSFNRLFNNFIVSDAVRQWAVREAVRRVSDVDFHTIVCRCFEHNPDATFTEAVNRRLWATVSDLMEDVVDRVQSSLAVAQAAKYADEYHLSVLIRCYCGDDMLEEILWDVASRGLWGAVHEILQRGVSDTGRTLAVEEALKGADDAHLVDILRHCTEDQLDSVLRELAKRRLWNSVGDLLQGNVSDSSRRLVVEEASKHASDDQLFHLLQHCAQDQVVLVLEEAVKRHLWLCVDELLRSAKYLAGWAVLEASMHAEEHLLVSLLSLCPDGQLDPVLTELVRRRMWKLVGEMIKRRVAETKKTWAIEEASKHATEEELNHLLPVCTDSQLDIVLTEAVNRGLWSVVQELLRREPSHALRKWVVDEASEHAPDDVLCVVSQYCCSSEQHELVCRNAVRRCMWKTVKTVARGLSREQQKWVILEVSKSATGSDFNEIVLTWHSFGDDVHSSLVRNLLARDQWDLLAHLGRSVLTDTQIAEVIREASERADESNLKLCLFACPPRMSEFVLTSAVKRGFWTVVKDLIGWDTTDKVKRWAIEETMKYADNKEFSSIIPLCDDDQLDVAIDEAISRRLWEDLDILLDRLRTCSQPDNAINTQIVWAIVETSKCADADCVKQRIQKFFTNGRVSLDPVMEVVVRRGMWSIVALILEDHIVGEETQRQAVEKALKFAQGSVLRTIIHHCLEDQMDLAVKTMTDRGQFMIVPDLLKRGVSNTMQTWVVGQAVERAADEDMLGILPYSPDDQLESILTKAVERCMWSSLKSLLANPRVTDEKRQCVVVESCRSAPWDVIIDVLLPYCTEETFDIVLTSMIQNHRGYYKVLNELFCRADDEQRVQLVVDHAVEQMGGANSLVSSCIRESLWTILSYALHQSDKSDYTWERIIENVFYSDREPLCTDRDFHRMLRHCSTAQRMSALEAAVKKNQSSTARDILSCIGQHGDPLAVTEDNQTVLDLALDIRDSRRELIAECVNIGATDRSQREELWFVMLRGPYQNLVGYRSGDREVTDELWDIVRVLYESGSCSIADLQTLYFEVQPNYLNKQSLTNDAAVKLTRNLETIIFKPRTLQSACRLVISRHLGVGRRRQERVEQLGIPKSLKNYLLFLEERDACCKEVVINDGTAREDGDGDEHSDEDDEDDSN